MEDNRAVNVAAIAQKQKARDVAKKKRSFLVNVTVVTFTAVMSFMAFAYLRPDDWDWLGLHYVLRISQ